MKKRIIIVTWIGGGNFGSCLQSFALHRKLETLGYDVSIIRTLPQKFTTKIWIKNILSILGLPYSFKKSSLPKEQQRKVAKFQKDNYKFVDILSKNQLERLLSSTDVFVTGSDQIWNTQFSLNPTKFLDFAKKNKRIAYGSSIGLADFPTEHKPLVKKWLLPFAHIGVREKTGKEILERLLGRKDIVQVLDPTFLFTEKEWRKIAEDSEIEFTLPKRYILCYFVGARDNYPAQLKKVKKATGIKDVVMLPSTEHPDFILEDTYCYNCAGPKEFVKILSNASFVCTDSFHATAFSINFSKPFVEFMRFDETDVQSQNSRIYDILKHYGLENRIYSETDSKWQQEIDYASIVPLLQNDRLKSLSFLVDSIEN